MMGVKWGPARPEVIMHRGRGLLKFVQVRAIISLYIDIRVDRRPFGDNKKKLDKSARRV